MLAKPLMLMLAFCLTLVNMVFLSIPLGIIFLPIYLILGYNTIFVALDIGIFIVASISCFMVLYLLFDMFFGMTARRLTKGCPTIGNAGEMLREHDRFERHFLMMKSQFNLPKAELFISPSNKVNAYAVGSFRRKVVIMTMGLINTIYQKSENRHQLDDTIKGILGHELSHLKNKDFLPGNLVYANQVIQNFISKFIYITFHIALLLFLFIPYIGRYIRKFLFLLHNITTKYTQFFYKFLFMPFYNFLYKWFNRSIEYRCDLDAAKVIGGSGMATALSMLGKGAYFSIFSTHPRTKHRINHIKDARPTGAKIRQGFFNMVATFFALCLLIFVAYLFASQVRFDDTKALIIYPIMNHYDFFMNWLNGWL
tara:strand:+ start:181 stop:1284 length:1104 start_codon:yes stop_codon:yes gene_type:complete